MPKTKARKTKKIPARKRRQRIPAPWNKIIQMIPGYDPVATAGDCRFDAAAAEHAVEFFPTCLRHVKGPCPGKPFKLELPQQAIIGNLFGWKRPDGTRRYREVFYFVGKKNGKTALAAGVLLYVMTQDHELGAELYSAAGSRDQAALVYNHAVGMIKQNKHLTKMLKVYGARGGTQHRSITYESTLSSYKALAGKAELNDGASPHLVIVDELHRHKTPDLVEMLIMSTASRRQPIVFIITTSDYERESICNRKHKYATDVRDGRTDDPEFLPIIYEASKDDDWKKPKTWKKANPLLGITLPRSFLARECRRAQTDPVYLNTFLRLHLNIRTEQATRAIPMDEWDACPSELDPADLLGQPCWGGLDLSSTKDIAALNLCFRLEKGVGWLTHLWIPEEEAKKREDRDGAPYRAWRDLGLIEFTPGNTIDYRYIRRRVNELDKLYSIQDIGYDPYNATHIVQQLQDEDGFRMVEFRQGTLSMNEPTKETLRLVSARELNHGGNIAMRWMAGNFCVITDASGNLRPDKKHSSEKIDGIVAGIMSVGRALIHDDSEESIYETEELLVL